MRTPSVYHLPCIFPFSLKQEGKKEFIFAIALEHLTFNFCSMYLIVEHINCNLRTHKVERTRIKSTSHTEQRWHGTDKNGYESWDKVEKTHLNEFMSLLSTRSFFFFYSFTAFYFAFNRLWYAMFLPSVVLVSFLYWCCDDDVTTSTPFLQNR